MNDTLSQAIATARSGQLAAAADALRAIVEREPRNAEAWLWLSGVTADSQECLRALYSALAIDPMNQRALQGLQTLRQQYPELFRVAEGGADGNGAAAAGSNGTLRGTSGAADDLSAGGNPYRTQALPVHSGDAPVYPKSIHTAPTLAQSVAVVPPTQVGTTAQMPVAPPVRRNPLAVVARVLLTLLWLCVTATLIVAAAWLLRITTRTPNAGIPREVQILLGAVAMPASLATVQILGYVLLALGVVGIVGTLGTLFRWRVGLVLSLLVSFVVAAAGVIVAVVPYSGGGDLTGLGDLLNLDARTAGLIAGVLLIWPMLLVVAAWSEFSRRRTI